MNCLTSVDFNPEPVWKRIWSALHFVKEACWSSLGQINFTSVHNIIKHWFQPGARGPQRDAKERLRGHNMTIGIRKYCFAFG